MMERMIHLWVTPKLPREHIFIPPEKRPKNPKEIIRVYFRKWVVHPIKRRIAKYYLLFLQNFFNLTVIGITGSAGKTTTKEMIASILKLKGVTVATYANIDPVYNIPTTVLNCRPNTKYLILEMGVEFPGEMDFYLWLARPNIGVITNIHQTHTLYLDNIEGVAKEKGKLIKALSKSDIAVLNSENKYIKEIGRKSKSKVVWFGDKEIRAENIRITKDMKSKFTLFLGQSKINVQLPILGRQFVHNALAAAATGYALGIDTDLIKQGLEDFKRPEHRMNLIKLKSGALIIDDSYNNNPQAAKDAIETFTAIAGDKKKIVVFGDMLELGRYEKKTHREIGRILAEIGLDYLIAVGSKSKILTEEATKTMNKGKITWVENYSAVLPILKPRLKKNVIVLIKGSRSIGLDRVVSDVV